ncbi:MAG TPA: AtpZ/AtpI family protein [Pilimelia sp.]|nr:AtpZ/AtpI family protein [Pilimelia sp.]
MAGDQPSQRPGDPGDPAPSAGQGWTALAYLIGGIAVWGFIGWVVDQWLDTEGVFLGIGAVVGAAGGIYLVVRRLGAG